MNNLPSYVQCHQAVNTCYNEMLQNINKPFSWPKIWYPFMILGSQGDIIYKILVKLYEKSDLRNPSKRHKPKQSHWRSKWTAHPIKPQCKFSKWALKSCLKKYVECKFSQIVTKQLDDCEHHDFKKVLKTIKSKRLFWLIPAVYVIFDIVYWIDLSSRCLS